MCHSNKLLLLHHLICGQLTNGPIYQIVLFTKVPFHHYFYLVHKKRSPLQLFTFGHKQTVPFTIIYIWSQTNGPIYNYLHLVHKQMVPFTIIYIWYSNKWSHSPLFIFEALTKYPVTIFILSTLTKCSRRGPYRVVCMI